LVRILARKRSVAMRLLAILALVVVSRLLCCFSAAAQTTSTEILGTITDASGALVPGAKVTLVRVSTGERRQTSTTSTGDYSFPLIETGEYVVTATKEGFTTQEKTGIEVQLQQKARVNFELTVGAATQTVAVVASGVELKVQTGSYSAKYGTNNGALVQVSLKSGTNQLHGTLYEFLRNDHMDAADYFLNFQVPAGTALAAKNPLRRNQFGAFLSGPVRLPKVYNGKDRTFWSFSYEGLRQYQGTVA